MLIFVDTNIFLDLILKREKFQEALVIFNAIDKGLFEGIVLDISILNIDYIAKKQTKDTHEFLSTVNSIFKVVGATNQMIEKALDIPNKDLEDNLQYICAKECNCELIITNDKLFYTKDLEKLTSSEFVNRFI